MSRIAIITVIAVTGAILWVIQNEQIKDVRSQLGQIIPGTSEKGPRVTAGRSQDRPLPTRRSALPDAGDRVLFPEKRNATRSTETASASSPIVTHLAGELADRLHLSAEHRTRVLPLLERHTSMFRQASTELIGSTVFHYTDLSDKKGTILSTLGGYAEFHAAARTLNTDTTKEILPLLEPKAQEILKAQDAAQRANTMTLLTDEEYSGWKQLLGFEGVEQQAYAIFYDLSEFRLSHPLPENFTREELTTRLADERRYLTESLTPLLSEEKALAFRQSLEGFDSLGTAPEKH